MKKMYFVLGLCSGLVFILMAAQNVENRRTASWPSRVTTEVPLRMKNVRVIKHDIKTTRALIRKGWILQDTDIYSGWSYYTLIKY